MESRNLALIEIIDFNIKYNKKALIDDWKSKDKVDISKVDIKYINEVETKLKKKLTSTKIGDLRKEFSKNIQRTDIVSECNTFGNEILNIITEIKNAIPNAEIGTVAYFFQKKGEDVPVHVDFPYRKNSLLLIPLFGKATTFYENGSEYTIETPVIMNVNIPHGVKNVIEDRLCLHIEILNLSAEKIKEYLYE